MGWRLVLCRQEGTDGDRAVSDLMILEVFSSLRNSMIVPGRSREAAKAETAARHLQVVPEHPHCSWVSPWAETARDSWRTPDPCG